MLSKTTANKMINRLEYMPVRGNFSLPSVLCFPLNVMYVVPNFSKLSGYVSSPTRLPPIAGSQTLARVIISLYYLYNTTYVIILNFIIYGFEPGSPGPKAEQFK